MQLNVKIKSFITTLLIFQNALVVFSHIVPVLNPEETFYYSASSHEHELRQSDLSPATQNALFSQHITENTFVHSCPCLDTLLQKNDVVDFLEKLISLIKENGPTSRDVLDYVKDKLGELTDRDKGPFSINGNPDYPSQNIGNIYENPGFKNIGNGIPDNLIHNPSSLVNPDLISNSILSSRLPNDKFHQPPNKLSIEVTGDDVLKVVGSPSPDNKLSLTLDGINNFNILPSSNPNYGNSFNKVPGAVLPHDIGLINSQHTPSVLNHDFNSPLSNGFDKQSFRNSPPQNVLSLEVTGSDSLSVIGLPSPDNKLSLSLSGVDNFSVLPSPSPSSSAHVPSLHHPSDSLRGHNGPFSHEGGLPLHNLPIEVSSNLPPFSDHDAPLFEAHQPTNHPLLGHPSPFNDHNSPVLNDSSYPESGLTHPSSVLEVSDQQMPFDVPSHLLPSNDHSSPMLDSISHPGGQPFLDHPSNVLQSIDQPTPFNDVSSHLLPSNDHGTPIDGHSSHPDDQPFDGPSHPFSDHDTPMLDNFGQPLLEHPSNVHQSIDAQNPSGLPTHISPFDDHSLPVTGESGIPVDHSLLSHPPELSPLNNQDGPIFSGGSPLINHPSDALHAVDQQTPFGYPSQTLPSVNQPDKNKLSIEVTGTDTLSLIGSPSLDNNKLSLSITGINKFNVLPSNPLNNHFGILGSDDHLPQLDNGVLPKQNPSLLQQNYDSPLSSDFGKQPYSNLSPNILSLEVTGGDNLSVIGSPSPDNTLSLSLGGVSSFNVLPRPSSVLPSSLLPSSSPLSLHNMPSIEEHSLPHHITDTLPNEVGSNLSPLNDLNKLPFDNYDHSNEHPLLGHPSNMPHSISQQSPLGHPSLMSPHGDSSYPDNHPLLDQPSNILHPIDHQSPLDFPSQPFSLNDLNSPNFDGSGFPDHQQLSDHPSNMLPNVDQHSPFSHPSQFSELYTPSLEHAGSHPLSDHTPNTMLPISPENPLDHPSQVPAIHDIDSIPFDNSRHPGNYPLLGHPLQTLHADNPLNPNKLSIEITGNDLLSVTGSPSPDNDKLSLSITGVNNFNVLPSTPSHNAPERISPVDHLPHSYHNGVPQFNPANIDQRFNRPISHLSLDKSPSPNILSLEVTGSDNLSIIGSPSPDNTLSLSLGGVNSFSVLPSSVSPTSSPLLMPSSHNTFGNPAIDAVTPHNFDNLPNEVIHQPSQMDYHPSLDHPSEISPFGDFGHPVYNSLSDHPSNPLSDIDQSNPFNNPSQISPFNESGNPEDHPLLGNPSNSLNTVDQMSPFDHPSQSSPFDNTSNSENLLPFDHQSPLDHPSQLSPFDNHNAPILTDSGYPEGHPLFNNPSNSLHGIDLPNPLDHPSMSSPFNDHIAPGFDHSGHPSDYPALAHPSDALPDPDQQNILSLNHPPYSLGSVNPQNPNKLSIEITGNDFLSLTGSPSDNDKLSLSITGINNFNVLPAAPSHEGINPVDQLPQRNFNTRLPQLQTSPEFYLDHGSPVIGNHQFGNSPSPNTLSLEVTGNDNLNIIGSPLPDNTLSLSLSGVDKFSVLPPSPSLAPVASSMHPTSSHEINSNMPPEFTSQHFGDNDRPYLNNYDHPSIDLPSQSLHSFEQQKPNKLAIEISGDDLLSLAGTPSFHNHKLLLSVNGVDNFNVVPKYGPFNTASYNGLPHNIGDAVVQVKSPTNFGAPLNSNIDNLSFSNTSPKKFLSLEVTGDNDLGVIGSSLHDNTLSLSLGGVDNFSLLPSSHLSPLGLSNRPSSSSFNNYHPISPTGNNLFSYPNEVPGHSSPFQNFNHPTFGNFNNPLSDRPSESFNSIEQPKYPYRLSVGIAGNDKLHITGSPAIASDEVALSVTGIDDFTILPSFNPLIPNNKLSVNNFSPYDFQETPQKRKHFPFDRRFSKSINDYPVSNQPLPNNVVSVEVTGNDNWKIFGTQSPDKKVSLSLTGFKNFNVLPITVSNVLSSPFYPNEFKNEVTTENYLLPVPEDHAGYSSDESRSLPPHFDNNFNDQLPFNDKSINELLDPVSLSSASPLPINKFSLKVCGTDKLKVIRKPAPDSDKISLAITGVDDFDVVALSGPFSMPILNHKRSPPFHSGELTNQGGHPVLFSDRIPSESHNPFYPTDFTPAHISRYPDNSFGNKRERGPSPSGLFDRPTVKPFGYHPFNGRHTLGNNLRPNILSIEVTGNDILSLIGTQSVDPGHKLSLSIVGIDYFSVAPSTMFSSDPFYSSQPDDSGFTVYENEPSLELPSPDEPIVNNDKVYKIVSSDTTTTAISETIDNKMSLLITGLEEFGVLSPSSSPSSDGSPFGNRHDSIPGYFDNKPYEQSQSSEHQPKKNKVSVEFIGIDDLNIINSVTDSGKLALKIGYVDRFEVKPDKYIPTSSLPSLPDDNLFGSPQKDLFTPYNHYSDFVPNDSNDILPHNQDNLDSVPSFNKVPEEDDDDYYQKIITETNTLSRKKHSKRHIFSSESLDSDQLPNRSSFEESSTDFIDTLPENRISTGNVQEIFDHDTPKISNMKPRTQTQDLKPSITETTTNHVSETGSSKPSHSKDDKNAGVSLALNRIETITVTRTLHQKITLTIYGIEGFDVINSHVVKPELETDNKVSEHHVAVNEHPTGTEYRQSVQTFGSNEVPFSSMEHLPSSNVDTMNRNFIDNTPGIVPTNEFETVNRNFISSSPGLGGHLPTSHFDATDTNVMGNTPGILHESLSDFDSVKPGSDEDSIYFVKTTTDTSVNKRKKRYEELVFMDQPENNADDTVHTNIVNSIVNSIQDSVSPVTEVEHHVQNDLLLDKEPSQILQDSHSHTFSSTTEMDPHHSEIYKEVQFIESLHHHQPVKPSLSITNLDNLNIPGSILTKTKGVSFNIIGADTKAVFKPDENDHDKVTLVITGIDELALESVSEHSKNSDAPGLAISGISDLDLTPILPPAPEITPEVVAEDINQNLSVTTETPVTVVDNVTEGKENEYTFVITETETIRRKRHRKVRIDGTLGSSEEDEEIYIEDNTPPELHIGHTDTIHTTTDHLTETSFIPYEHEYPHEHYQEYSDLDNYHPIEDISEHHYIGDSYDVPSLSDMSEVPQLSDLNDVHPVNHVSEDHHFVFSNDVHPVEDLSENHNLGDISDVQPHVDFKDVESLGDVNEDLNLSDVNNDHQPSDIDVHLTENYNINMVLTETTTHRTKKPKKPTDLSSPEIEMPESLNQDIPVIDDKSDTTEHIEEHHETPTVIEDTSLPESTTEVTVTETNVKPENLGTTTTVVEEVTDSEGKLSKKKNKDKKTDDDDSDEGTTFIITTTVTTVRRRKKRPKTNKPKTPPQLPAPAKKPPVITKRLPAPPNASSKMPFMPFRPPGIPGRPPPPRRGPPGARPSVLGKKLPLPK